MYKQEKDTPMKNDVEKEKGTWNAEHMWCEWCLTRDAQGKFYVPGKGIFWLCEHCSTLMVSMPIDED